MHPTLHVLLVEDDPLTAFHTRRALHRNHDIGAITVAVDGQEALDRLHDGTVAVDRALVLTDVRMPRMSGLELASAIRADPGLRAVPVVVVTNLRDDETRQAAYALDVLGYFVKSATGRYLDAVLAWLSSYCGGDDRDSSES